MNIDFEYPKLISVMKENLGCTYTRFDCLTLHHKSSHPPFQSLLACAHTALNVCAYVMMKVFYVKAILHSMIEAVFYMMGQLELF